VRDPSLRSGCRRHRHQPRNARPPSNSRSPAAPPQLIARPRPARPTANLAQS
jgi:hypothetical protein